MAFLPPNEENTQAPTGQTTSGLAQMPPVSGGSAGAGAGAPKAGAAPGVGTPTQFGTSATKLGDYLSANAPQIQAQAGQMAGNLTNQYGEVKGGIGEAVNQFGQQVKQGYTGFDQAAIDAAVQNAMKGQVGQQDVNAVQSRLNNQYQGPAAFEQTDPYSQVQANVQKAAQNAQLLTTQPGIRSYYQGNYGQEAPGMATLDTALLTSSPEAYGQVQQAAAPYSGLGSYLAQQSAQANTAIPAAQQEIQQGKQYATQKLTTAQQNMQDAISNALSQQQAAAQSQNQQLKQNVQNKTMSAADLAQLGITQDQWNALNQQITEAATPKEIRDRNAAAMTGTSAIDLSPYLQLQNPNTAITAANVATPEQLAQTQALQQLSAGQWGANPLGGLTEVGKPVSPMASFNYQDALTKATSTNQAQQSAAKAYVDAINAGLDADHAMQRAQEVSRGTAESVGLALLNNTVGMPLAVATQIPGIGKPIARAVDTVVNTISNVFCFDGHTEVEMADGSHKEIKKIDLGDQTKGGEVLGTLQAYVDEMYTYEGVEVSGKHAVKEDGKWVRVEDSKNKRFRHIGKYKVYCLVTSKHRIWSHGVEFSDYVETDDHENLTIGQSLERLNVA